MNYRLSVDVIGSTELAAAMKQAPQVTIQALSTAIGKTAYKVENRAKAYAPIDKGSLRGSIHTQGPRATRNNVEATVGTNIKYAKWQEQGTGIYGPRKQMIVPVRAKRLAFKVGGAWVYARQVRGVKPQRYIRKAKQETVPDFTEYMREALTTIVSALAT